MTNSPSREEWEEQFDKEFTISHPGDSGPGGGVPQEPVYEVTEIDPNEYKKFIRQLLLSKDSELREKMRSLRKKTDDELLEVRTQNDLWKVCGNNRDIGYNQALDNVLDLLNKDHE